jgi:hypothetical protein
MSALQLRKVKQSSLETDSCLEEGCNRKGRYALAFAGHPVLSASPMTRGRQTMLCPKHRLEWLRIWSELSGEAWAGEAAASVEALASSTTQRTEAIFHLRGLGFSPAAVKDAAAQAKQGDSTEQILDALSDTKEPIAA